MAASFSVALTVSPAVVIPTTNLSVVITYGGVSTAYAQTGAQNMGAYTDPQGEFVQQCYRAARQDSALPGLTVWFRPDSTSTRKEIIVELGVPLVGLTPANMTAYTAAIYDDGVLQTTINVPLHYWFSRWRWQSLARPVRTTTAALIASGLLPHYDPSTLGRFNGNEAAHTYSVMGFAGMTTAMGGTGERPDIGIMPNWSANYICNGALLSTVLAQGEASGTVGMHIRDPDTGAPIDMITKYPRATMYSASAGSPFVTSTVGLVAYDDGHDPAMSYLPALLTGDPYFIEALQFQSNYEMIGAPPQYRYTKAGRYGAWGLRNKAYATVMSPASPPAWMLPKATFHSHMENVRQKMILDMAKTSDPIYEVFRARDYGGSQGSVDHPSGTYTAFWQHEFEVVVYAMCVQLGFTEWAPQLEWAVVSTIARTNGTSWPRCTPAPYFTQLRYTSSLAADCSPTDTTITVNSYGAAPWPSLPFAASLQNENITVTAMSGSTWTITRDPTISKRLAHLTGVVLVGPKFTTWAELAARENAAYAKEVPRMPGDPTGMNTIYNATTGSVAYTQYTRAALAMAARNGVTDAVAPLAWLNAQFAIAVRPAWAPKWTWCIT